MKGSEKLINMLKATEKMVIEDLDPGHLPTKVY